MTEDEFRKIFDTLPEAFDQYRPRYCPELFKCLWAQSGIATQSSVLELGPGTGQATEPFLNAGCTYTGIELGDNFTKVLNQKYGTRTNFHLIHDDFITHDFGDNHYNLIVSATTIQWIPEPVAFAKTFTLLSPGGMLAMFLTRRDFRTPNPALFDKIQQVYTQYFHPEIAYTHGSFCYENALKYGYVDFQKHEFHTTRFYTADEYVAYCGTHCDHIVIPEPFQSKLYAGIHQAIMDYDNKIELRDSHVLMTVRKPETAALRNE